MQPFLDAIRKSEAQALGGFGVVVAAALIAASFFLLPRAERFRVKVPLWMLVAHVALVLVGVLVPAQGAAHTMLQTLALFFVLASVGQSAFSLLLNAIWVRRLARPLPTILRDVLQAFLYMLVLIVSLRAAGVEPGSLLTTSALLTAVVGLSLQDTLGNLFAGLAIQAQRPFTVGDWIQFDGKTGHVGRVIEINWRATRVLTLDQVEVTVPNGTVAKAPIINYTRPSGVVRREVELFAPPEVSPARVQELVIGALREVPDVREQPAPTLFTAAFDERGMRYALRYFIDDFAVRERVASDVRSRTWYALSRGGVSVPAPRRQVSVRRDAAPQSAAIASLEDRSARLRALPVLASLPAAEIETLTRQASGRIYGPGDVIVRAGDPEGELFVIHRGEVVVRTSVSSGASVEVARLGPGDFFGEVALLTEERRAATVSAATETEVVVIARDVMAKVMARRPELAEEVSRVLNERRRELTQVLGSQRPDGAVAQEDERLELLNRIRRFFSL